MVACAEGSRLIVRLTRCGPEQLSMLLTEQRQQRFSDQLRRLGLTPREAEVLYWISEGKSNPEIGIILGNSPRTVAKQVESILAKLGVENRAGAMLRAREAAVEQPLHATTTGAP
jgi:DNA-binding CsgD family transcriptional regulator